MRRGNGHMWRVGRRGGGWGRGGRGGENTAGLHGDGRTREEHGWNEDTTHVHVRAHGHREQEHLVADAAQTTAAGLNASRWRPEAHTRAQSCEVERRRMQRGRYRGHFFYVCHLSDMEVQNEWTENGSEGVMGGVSPRDW